jgi:N-acetyl-anhydromuramyl-L-alanine amidase AmpD
MPYQEYDVSNEVDPRLVFVRGSTPIGTLMHTTSGANSLRYLLGGVLAEGRIACADVLIARDGRRWQIAPRGMAAYHAGQSCLTPVAYTGNKTCLYSGNEVSRLLIGIEVECLDSERPTYNQYDSAAEYIVRSAIDYGWRWPYIIYGHYGVARPVTRRADPVSYDWGALMGRLYVYSMNNNIGGLG